jgi:hypothetical protein
MCSVCGGATTHYSQADMAAMIDAYAGPLAKSQNLPPKPTYEPGAFDALEVEVDPKSGGEPITYSGIAIERHVNCCHALPAVGETFWSHHPKLAPHVAKFELGKITAVRPMPPGGPS